MRSLGFYGKIVEVRVVIGESMDIGINGRDVKGISRGQ